MPAVDNSSNTVNQCSKLNKTSFPTLWFDTSTQINQGSSASSDSTRGPLTATNGVPKTFKSSIQALTPTQINGNILEVPESSSAYSLLKFLSGGSVTGGVDYKLLTNVLLYDGVIGTGVRAYKSIVDDYFVPRLGSTPYTYSTSQRTLITSSMMWAPSDKNILKTGGQPTSILGKIIASGFLLKETDIFKESDFDSTQPLPVAETETLMYLQSIGNTNNNARGITAITTQQIARRTTLEARNPRFFGAWLAEYCYYRSRYNWVMNKFYEIYTKIPYDPPNITTHPLSVLFAGSGSGPNQYTDATKERLPQSEFLRCLIYHMACLNTRMVDMRFLLGKMSEYYSEVQTVIQNAVNDEKIIGSNDDLTNKINGLNDSASKVQNYITERDFRQGVMNYNLEKNRYANILLGLYAFLNILAVAVIVQIKQS